MKELWFTSAEGNVLLATLLRLKLTSTPEIFLHFLLDPSTGPEVILASQTGLVNLGSIFYLTRTWCYGIHRRRLQLTGRFKNL